MKVYVLAFDKVFDTGLSTVLDTFGVANVLAESTEGPSTKFDVTIANLTSAIYILHFHVRVGSWSCVDAREVSASFYQTLQLLPYRASN